MTPEQITFIIRETLLTALEIAAPFLLLALLIGIFFSIIQSVAHLHEMTLSFVPKMIIIGAAVALLFPWMLKILTKFTHNLIICQWEKVTTCIQYVQ